MKVQSMMAILIVAGIVAIVAAFWSGSGAALGPVRMGEGGISQSTRYIIMILALLGGIGAVITGFIIKKFSAKPLGIASLIFAALLVPSVFQANTLSILSLLLIAIVGITLLVGPSRELPGHTVE